MRGVQFIGSGSAVPPGLITNADLERILDTSDQWIVSRTGIHERHKCDPGSGEGVLSLSIEALTEALADAGIAGSELDLVIETTITSEMTCPATACRVADAVGAVPAGAFDLIAACSGFVYATNVAESLISSGRYHTVGVVGCDAFTTITDYSDRSVAVLAGDAAGAVIMQGVDDPEIGCLAQSMHSDGSLWDLLYVPRCARHAPPHAQVTQRNLGYLQMRGAEVFEFAVRKFPEALHAIMRKAHVKAADLKVVIAHQTNKRILDATCRRLELDKDKIYVNLARFGNTSAGSLPLCFDELWRQGTIGSGDIIAMIGLGGGMTWAASVWRL